MYRSREYKQPFMSNMQRGRLIRAGEARRDQSDHQGADMDSKRNTLSAWRRTSKDANKLKLLERVAGIEPAYSAWKAAALPLSYTRGMVKIRLGMVEGVGFEPT